MIVHVYGLPDDRALRHDERTCDEPDREQLVVFHLCTVHLTRGGWACRVCGSSSEEEPDGRA